MLFQTKQAVLRKAMYQNVFWAFENRLNLAFLWAVLSHQTSKFREIISFQPNPDLITSKYTGYELQKRGAISF